MKGIVPNFGFWNTEENKDYIPRGTWVLCLNTIASHRAVSAGIIATISWYHSNNLIHTVLFPGSITGDSTEIEQQLLTE